MELQGREFGTRMISSQAACGQLPCREELVEEVVVVVVVAHREVERVRGGFGRGWERGGDGGDGGDGGAVELEKGRHEEGGGVSEQGLGTGKGLHKMACGCGGEACSGDRRVLRREHEPDTVLQLRHVSRRCVGSLCDTPLHIQHPSRSCTLSRT